MSNVYAFHPTKSAVFSFYEVVGEDGYAVWGGESTSEALKWLKTASEGARVLVSAWDTPDLDAHLIGQSIDITDILMEAMKGGER